MAAVFSFFSGVGMLDLGFEENGYEIVKINEYEEEFLTAYKYSRRNHGHVEPRFGYENGDFAELLKGVNIEQIRDQIRLLKEEGHVVGFIGGPPCPDFSVGGKNKGHEGDNGILTDRYFELIGRCEPDFFVFENVKGLVRTQKHRDFFEKKKRYIKRKGYIIQDEVLNAMNFGVPQDRERIIMIGFRNRTAETGLMVHRRDVKEFFTTLNQRLDSSVIKDYPWPTSEPFQLDSHREPVGGIPLELTTEYWFNRNDVENHPNGNDVFVVRNGRAKMETIKEGDTKRKSFKRLHRWRYSPTAAYGHNEVHLHPYKVRRLSASEAMAIQSLPRWFELPEDMYLSKKFKTIGNGVPYLMSREIARALNIYIENIERV